MDDKPEICKKKHRKYGPIYSNLLQLITICFVKFSKSKDRRLFSRTRLYAEKLCSTSHDVIGAYLYASSSDGANFAINSPGLSHVPFSRIFMIPSNSLNHLFLFEIYLNRSRNSRRLGMCSKRD